MTGKPVLRERAKSMRTNMTPAELKVWNALRAHRLMGLSFRRQVPVQGYIADFVCPKYGLIVELDGSQHGELQAQYDQRRDQILREAGYSVLRFWNDDALRDIDGVCGHILAHLAEMGVKFD